MSWSVLLVQSCTFTAVSLVTFLVFRGIWSLDRRLRSRLQDLSGRHVAFDIPKVPRRDPKAAQSVRSRLVALAGRLTPNDQREAAQIRTRLQQAGIYAPWAPSVFVSVKLFLIVTPPLVGFAIGESRLFNPTLATFYGAIAGGIGIVAPSIWLERRKARRHAILLRSLPDFLDLMATCVQSGLSLEASLQRVADELEVAHPVLAREIAIVEQQMELGATTDAALRNFAERSDLGALYSLSSLIEQARRFGTSVTDALRTQAEMLRYQREQAAEELAQKASVKILFPTLLFIFPAIFVVLVGPAAVQLHEKFGAQQSSVVRAN
jgi:tight adherence protein C